MAKIDTDRQRCGRCGELTGGGACSLHGVGAVPARKSGMLFGLFDFLRGAMFMLRHPGMWHWVFLPFLINIGLWALLYVYGVEKPLRDWVYPRLDEVEWLAAWGWLKLLIRIGLTSVFAVVALVLFGFLGSLVNAPFYDFLSEATEKRYLGGLAGPPVPGLVARCTRSFWAAGKAGIYCGFWYLVWLPVLLLQPFGSLIYFLVCARLRTFELLVFSFARKLYRLGEMRSFCNRVFMRSFGLGAVVNLCILIPGATLGMGGWAFLPVIILVGMVGWLSSPLAVVGATLLYLDSDKGPATR